MEYEELAAWRDICEFLNLRWYKFDETNSIISHARNPEKVASLISPEGRANRQWLWDFALIQFTHWGNHPVLDFRNSRDTRAEFKNDRGWTLVYGWEAKIDFLEQVVLLERSPDDLPKPWQPIILARLQERMEKNKPLEATFAEGVIPPQSSRPSYSKSDPKADCVLTAAPFKLCLC